MSDPEIMLTKLGPFIWQASIVTQGVKYMETGWSRRAAVHNLQSWVAIDREPDHE